MTPLPRRLSFASLALVIVASLATVVPAAVASPDRAFVERAVVRGDGLRSGLVHVRPGSSMAEGLEAARVSGLDIGTRYDVINVFVAYGTPDEFRAVAGHGTIEALEANRKLRTFTETSHIATRGQEVLDGAVTMPDGAVIDGTGVGVAVVDSGVDGTHPDLQDRMGGNVKIVCSTPMVVATAPTGGFRECLGPKTAVPMADTDTPSGGGHGTHVAGTVAGDGTASEGRFHGAAPGATLYGVSTGTTLSVENALDGLAWVLENHDVVTPAIKVVNNSWGSSPGKYDPEKGPFHKATWKLQEALVAEGVTVVFAAGNEGGNGTAQTTSAECVNPTPGVVCVANYDDKNEGDRNAVIDGSSSRGLKNDPMTWPDLAAPGTQITATCRLTLPVCSAHFAPSTEYPNLYSTLSGTSMAAPHIAGIVAQLYQANPALTPAEVENILEDTAYKFQWGTPYTLQDPTNPDDGSSFEKGHGLVDVVNAVKVAMGAEPDPEPTPTPTETGPPPPGPGELAPPARYYFHSGNLNNNADYAYDIVSSDYAVFDETAPTLSCCPSTAVDVPFFSNGSPRGPYDPRWTGAITGEIRDLTVDFWQKSSSEHVWGDARYEATVFVGSKAYQLPVFGVDVNGAGPTRVKHTFTTLIDAEGKEVPLSIPTDGSEPVTIHIRGEFFFNEGVVVLYDSTQYPSGFSVNTGGVDPQPSPTATPTPDPTAPPTGFDSTKYYFRSDSGLGNADYWMSDPVFATEAPTSSGASSYFDTPFITGDPAFDPGFKGNVSSRIDELEVDFWQRAPVAHAAGLAEYSVVLWVGSDTYTLPPIKKDVRATIGRAAERVTHRFTTMLDASGAEVPLSIDTEGSPMWIFLRGRNSATNGPVEIVYDSTTYPSGFTVFTKRAVTEPTPDPTQPTPEPTPTAAASTVEFTGASATATQYSDDAIIEATLTSNGEPIAGADLVFELTGESGTRDWTVSTTDEGVASQAVNFRDDPGSYQLTVRYAGAQDAYLPSADTTTFTVDRDLSDTVLTITGGPSNRGLSATTSDADSAAGLAGVAIEFFAGQHSLGTATTDETGTATLALPPRYRNPPQKFEAVFAGDAYYEASSDSRQT